MKVEAGKVGKIMKKDKSNLDYINPLKEAFRVALVYLIVSIIWIVFSDKIVLELVQEDTLLFKEIQTNKGIFFVFVSAAIIFSMIYHRWNSLLKLENEFSTHRKLSQAKMDYIDLHDSLTGLPKRLLLEKRFMSLSEGSHKEKNIALIHLEIDSIKQINESIGNIAGDQYMLYLSKILASRIRGDDLLARLSQDAFGILLADIETKEDIDNEVKSILEKIGRPWFYGGKEFNTTATAGVATYPEDCLEFYCLLRYSNIALKYAKLKNKGLFEYYSQDAEAEIIENLEIIDSIKKALVNNEYYLNYQIVMDLKTREVAGAEVLIRWQHPELGNIPPLTFIPIAEQSNLILDITDFVLNTALEQKKRWKIKGVNIPKISINISPMSMNTVGFCYYIEEKLREYGVLPNELILELTESTFIEDFLNIDTNIKYLRSLGVEIALDDFGTGYSTLARLKELNIDYIKLDRTFIKNIAGNNDDVTLVKSVIEVANILGIQVCAEGIETLEGLTILTEIGCTLGQGYFMHKPSKTLPLDFKLL